jgi:hypothetical protein
VTVPLTRPVTVFGFPAVNLADGALFLGEMVNVTVTAKVPPRPSDAVTTKPSVVTSSVSAPTAEAACRAAAVGV